MTIKLKAVHIGKAIERRRNELMLTKTELAQRIGVSCQRLNSILAKPTIDTLLLIKVSEAMDYDFFTLYSSGRKEDTFFPASHASACNNIIPSGKDEEAYMKALIKEKDGQIRFCEEKNKVLHEMVEQLTEKLKSVGA